MDIIRFRKIIEQLAYANEISRGEWDEEIDRCRQELTDVLLTDVPSSIAFLMDECTADEYSWISEVLDDIAAAPGGKSFIMNYKKLLRKFPEEVEKYNIANIIQEAEDIIEQEGIHAEKSQNSCR